MKPKIILMLEVPSETLTDQVAWMAKQFQQQVKKWSESPTDHILTLVVTAGCKLTGYAIPEEALVQIPEISIQVQTEKEDDRGKEDHLTT